MRQKSKRQKSTTNAKIYEKHINVCVIFGKVDKTGLIVLINRLNTNETPQTNANDEQTRMNANDNECNDVQTRMNANDNECK